MQLKEEFMQKYCFDTRNENRMNFNDILMGSANGDGSPVSINTDKDQVEEQDILNQYGSGVINDSVEEDDKNEVN